jgi:hypothetical protein
MPQSAKARDRIFLTGVSRTWRLSEAWLKLPELAYFRGLPRLAKINPWLSATRRSKPACLSALARCAPAGISRAFWRASTAMAFRVRLAGEAGCFMLFWTAFELLDPAVALPKFNIVTVDHFAGSFPCSVIVIADEIDGFHELAVTANKVRPIVRHDRSSLFRRFEFAMEPAPSGCVHGVGWDLRLMDMAAFGASQGPVLEAGTSRGNALNVHGRLAFETTGSLRRARR